MLLTLNSKMPSGKYRGHFISAIISFDPTHLEPIKWSLDKEARDRLRLHLWLGQ